MDSRKGGSLLFVQGFRGKKILQCLRWAILLGACAATAALQRQITEPVPPRGGAANEEALFSDLPLTIRLRDYLDLRNGALQRRNFERAFHADTEPAQKGLPNPPALFVHGIVLSGAKKYALISVDGTVQSAVVHEGEMVADDLRIVEIDGRGVAFLWRGRSIFVSLE